MPYTEERIVHLQSEVTVNAKQLTVCCVVFTISVPFCPLQDTVAMESMPLLGFTIAPEKEEGSSEVGPIFHLYHKKTLFYSFKAEDTNSAQRYPNNYPCLSLWKETSCYPGLWMLSAPDILFHQMPLGHNNGTICS